MGNILNQAVSDEQSVNKTAFSTQQSAFSNQHSAMKLFRGYWQSAFMADCRLLSADC
jgi:hypothetical protein